MAASEGRLSVLIEIQGKLDALQATQAELRAVSAEVLELNQKMLAASAVNPTAALTAGGPAASTILRDIAGAADGIGENAKKAAAEAGGLSEALKMGAAFAGVNFLAQGIHGIGEKIRETIAEGVRFNAEMERSGVAIAGSLRQADPMHVLNFGQAREIGVLALDALIAKANALGLELHSLTESFSINLKTMTEGGVRDLQKQIDLTVLLSQAAASKGLQGFQAQRDIVDLIQGMGDRTIFGKELGISNEEIKVAKEAGRLYEFLTQQLSAYKEAGEAAANTFTAALQRLTNELHQLEGEAAKPIFEALRGGINRLVQSLATPGLAGVVSAVSEAIARLVGGGLALANFAITNAAALMTLAEAVAAVAAAWGAAALVAKIGGLAMIADTVLVVLGALGPVLNVAFTAATEAVVGFFTALGPVGWTIIGLAAGAKAVSYAFGLYADAEREAAKEAENLRKASTSLKLELDRLGSRPQAEQFVTQEEAKIAALKREADAVRELEAEREAAEARGVTDPMGNAVAPNLAGASAQMTLQAIQQEITLRLGILDKARHLTDAELDRQKVEEELKNLLKAQDQILADMIGKLPAFVDGLRKAIGELREAQALYKMSAGQTVDYYSGDQQKRFAYLSEVATKLREVRGESAKWFDTKITDLDSLKRVSEEIGKIGGELKGTAGAAKLEAAKALGDYQAAADEAVKREGKLQQAIRARGEEEERQQAKLGDLDTQARINAAKASGNTTLARQLTIQAEALELQKKYHDAGRDITIAQARQLALEKELASEAGKKASAADAYARNLAKQTEAERAARIEELRAQRSAVHADPFLLTEQKMAIERVLLQQEREALIANIAAWKAYNQAHAGSGDARQQEVIVQNIKRIADAERELLKVRNAEKTSTFGGGFTASMVSYVNQLGTAAENTAKIVQNTLTTALNGVSNALTGIIFHTGSWKQASGQALQSIANQMIQVGLQMAQHYIMAKFFRESDTADSIQKAATKTSAEATPATLSSISSYGVAAAVGIAAVVAALAMAAAFDVGGYTGNMGRSQIAGVVHGDEFVVDSPTMHAWGGPATFAWMQSVAASGRSVGSAPASRGGGASTSRGARGGSGNRAQVNVAVLRDGHELRQWQESAQGQRHLVSLVRRNRLSMGIRT